MKKILIVITTAFVPYGGLTTVMMNYYHAMDKTDLQIDFASTNEIEETLERELEENSSRYFCLGERKKNLVSYMLKLRRVLKEGRYDVIHVNGNSATMALELWMAKIIGVPMRIAHGHNTKSNYPALHKVLKALFKRTYTIGIAVSQKTGDWLFPGGKYTLLNNAISINKYEYDSAVREKCRKELGLSEKIIVGNVGKLNVQKNHSFLIQIFNEVIQEKKQAHLLIAGGGELQEELESQCMELGIRDEITFLGMRNDISQLLQAMDVFVFPSLFEGLGMALIEAQAAGLFCIASDVVPRETRLSDNVRYVSLAEQPKIWAAEILKHINGDRRIQSVQACKEIRAQGYDIENAAGQLRNLYVKGYI